MIDEHSSLNDACFEVSAALERHGIHAVLTGGSAATVYAPEYYTSLDADFVLTNFHGRKELDAALAEIGYVPSHTVGMYEHGRSAFTLDFPKGPLAVGGDYIHETVVLEKESLRLRILTVTDCVRDRLSAFYHWGDFTALKAAVGVAKKHRDKVDFERIRVWTKRESGPPPLDFLTKYDEFLRRAGGNIWAR
jgi:hypothetical protein